MKINKFKNAYGIKNLVFNKDSRYRNHIIYASNGTFKSSFTKTMEKWDTGNSHEVLDRLTNELFEGEIDFNGSIKTHQESFDSCIIYKVEREEDDFFENIKNLIISSEMQIKLKDAKTGIAEVEKTFDSHLKKAKINSAKYFDEFHGFEKESFYRIYNAIKRVYEFDVQDLDISLIDFSQLFSKAYLALAKPEVKSSVNNYYQTIQVRKESELFSDDFTESNFNDVIKNLKKNSFLNENKGRSISIGNKTFNSQEELEEFYKKIIEDIFKGEEVVQAYNEVKKQLGTAKVVAKIQDNLKDLGFSEAIQQDRGTLCLEKLNQIVSKEELNEMLEKLNSFKDSIDEVYAESSRVQTEFELTINEFKKKFNPIFDIIIENIADSVLGVDQPKLKFIHKSNAELKIERSLLNDILSSGEKSALYILEFMFRLRGKLNSHIGDLLVVMDDVIETFDYSNRNGFIEYINELTDNENLHIFVLTHNFEFYKTLYTRCSKTMFPYFAERDEENNINVVQSYPFTKGASKYLKNIDSFEKVLVAIPFVREIKESIGEKTSVLDSALHYKKTTDYSLNDIIDNLNTLINIDKSKFSESQLNEKYYTLIKGNIDYEYDTEYNLSDKIVYSIFSRVNIEIKATEIKETILDGITKFQTAKLYNKIKNDSDFDSEFKKILHRVVLITPNFIHCNTFMYNPLVDIPTNEYANLFNEVINYEV